MTHRKEWAKEDMWAVIHAVGEGSHLKVALERSGMGNTTFWEWVHRYPDLNEGYAQARASYTELIVSEIPHIADNEPDAQKARNRIDARKWVASKFKPSEYGDRLDVNLNTTVDIKGALEEARSRVRDVLDISKTQDIETYVQLPDSALGSQPVEQPHETGSTVKNELDDLLD